MSLTRTQKRLLRQTLAAAHSSRESLPHSPNWRDGVMRFVRSCRKAPTPIQKPRTLCLFSWTPVRAVGFALVIVAVVAVCVGRFHDKARETALLKNPQDVVAAQLFFIE